MIKKAAILATVLAAALGTIGLGTAFANNGKGVGPSGDRGHARACHAHSVNNGHSHAYGNHC
jgi:hypothetical protein